MHIIKNVIYLNGVGYVRCLCLCAKICEFFFPLLFFAKDAAIQLNLNIQQQQQFDNILYTYTYVYVHT